MVKIIEQPIATITCKRCKCTLSYDWKDTKKKEIEGSMAVAPYTIFYIICPNCKNHVQIYRDRF